MKNNKVTVLIADDYALIRQGLKKILELEESINIVGEASDGFETIEKTLSIKPDVVLLDINMPKLTGLDALKNLKEKNVISKFIMLTVHDDKHHLDEALNIGADGYILKDADLDIILKAIHDVFIGETYIQPDLAVKLIKKHSCNKIDSTNKEKLNALTKREYEVISLIADGLNNKEIAQKLFISEQTVKNHVSNIFKKIEVGDRVQAAIFAYKNDIKKL